jgi:hypothetical protein
MRATSRMGLHICIVDWKGSMFTFCENTVLNVLAFMFVLMEVVFLHADLHFDIIE